MERLKERMTVARQALNTLKELTGKSEISKVERDAAIQRFEYSFEAVWKVIQLYLREEEGLDIGSPKGVVRASMQVGLLNETESRLALTMCDDRNQTVHTYNEVLAELIYGRIVEYAKLMDKWLNAIKV